MNKPSDEKVFSELDVIGRCKQCGKGVTDQNKVTGPTGMFCSAECKEKHEAFITRLEEMESRRRPPRLSLGFRIRKLLSLLIAVAFFAVVAGAVSIYFDIPVLAPLTWRILGLFGI